MTTQVGLPSSTTLAQQPFVAEAEAAVTAALLSDAVLIDLVARELDSQRRAVLAHLGSLWPHRLASAILQALGQSHDAFARCFR